MGLGRMSSYTLDIERRQVDVLSRRKTEQKQRDKKLFQNSVIAQGVRP